MVLIMMFVSAIQPVLMVGFLILITLYYSFFVYSVMGSYWFSYALMMVMLSGVLVVFTYMVSLVPNESFEVYNLGFLMLFVLVVVGGWVDMLNFSVNFVSLSLWVNALSMMNLFLVGFLLSIMLMVIWISDVAGAVSDV